MKSNKSKVVEYIKRTFRYYIFYPVSIRIFKSSLASLLRHLVSYLFSFFEFLLHADQEQRGVLSAGRFRRPKRVEEVEVLHKEGLMDIYNIASYLRSHFEKDSLLFISQEKKHSRYHIDYLVEYLTRIYKVRNKSSPILIKGQSCSFELIVYPLYRCSTKSLVISNIVKRNFFEDPRETFKDKKTSGLSQRKDQFFISRKMKVVDKITAHDGRDTRSSMEALHSFLVYYGEKIHSQNVSFFSPASSEEYKIMVLTDIVSSTKLWMESYNDMGMAITKHDYFALDLVDRYGGVLSRNEGDSFFIFFESVEKAVKFSLKFNKQIRKIKLLNRSLEIKIAIHAGVVKMNSGGSVDACGRPVNEISKMLSHTPPNKITIRESLFKESSCSSSDIFNVI